MSDNIREWTDIYAILVTFNRTNLEADFLIRENNESYHLNAT